jgi:hypothetical protein
MLSNLFPTQKEPSTPTKQKEGISSLNEASPLTQAFKINNLEKQLLVAQNNLEQQKTAALLELEQLPTEDQSNEGNLIY